MEPPGVQVVALVAFHVSVELWPAVIEIGEAVKVTRGGPSFRYACTLQPERLLSHLMFHQV